jgi:hypothetical protein
MTNTQSHSFLDLPSELRLQVYDSPVRTGLADGNPRNARGLYLSCKTIHDEMKAGNISKTRAILGIQKAWNATIRSHAPLRIQISPNYNFIGAMSEMSLLIPACNAYDPRTYPLTPHFLRLHRILSRVFHLKLSVLKLKFYYPGTMSDVEWSANIDIAARTLCTLHILKRRQQSIACFNNIDRLEMLLGTFGTPPSPLNGTVLKKIKENNLLGNELKKPPKR